MKNGFLLLGASALCTLALTSLPVTSLAGGPVKHKVSMKVKQFNYMPRFSVGPFYQTGTDSFGLYDLFVPFTMSSKSIFFLDGRYIDRGNTWEYNVGAGLRNISNSGNLLWTLYSFYDNRRTRFSNYFGQITVGADLQTEKWYFNTNGYIPVGKSQQFVDDFNTASLCNGNTRICYARGIEKSMGGWDAEVGRDLFWGFKGYAGMYVFARDGVKTAIGPNLRLQYNIERQNQKRVFYVFNKIALIANWRDDQLVGSSWYAGVRFDIGLGPDHHMVGLERKMTSFIRRDLNVEMSSDAKGNTADLTQPVRILTNDFDGQETQVALANAGITAVPFAALLANARNNIVGVRGTTAAIAAVSPMSANQILEGGVFTFTREGQTFSVQVGQNGVETGNPVAASFITPATGNTIENMTFVDTTPDTSAAILTVATFGNLVVQNTTATGIELVRLTPAAGTNTASILNNTVTNTAGGAANVGAGIGLFGGAAGTAAYTVSGNVFNLTVNTAEAGIRAVGAAGGVSVLVTNNTVNSVGTAADAGITFIGTLGLVNITGNMSGNTVNNTGVGGALFAVDSVTFQGNISGNAFTSATAAFAAGVSGVVTLAADTASRAVTVLGAISGNTITSTAAAPTSVAVKLQTTNATNSVVVNGGLVSNTINIITTASQSVRLSTVSGAVVIGAFNSNTFGGAAGIAAGAAVNSLATGASSIVIGAGQTVGNQANLELANGLAVGDAANINVATVISP